jgi:hypothetical protein
LEQEALHQVKVVRIEMEITELNHSSDQLLRQVDLRQMRTALSAAPVVLHFLEELERVHPLRAAVVEQEAQVTTSTVALALIPISLVRNSCMDLAAREEMAADLELLLMVEDVDLELYQPRTVAAVVPM